MLSDSNRETARRWAKRLECPVDENADYENNFWTNRDLIPIPYERRTWTWQGYSGYWVITGNLCKITWLFFPLIVLRCQYNSMDCRFEFAGVGAVGWAGNGSRRWGVCPIRHHSRFRRLDGKSSTSGFHSVIQKVRCS